MPLWYLVTRFGESTYLLPSAMLIAVWLCYRREPGSALRWLLVFVPAAGLTLVSKLAFMGWGLGVASLDFTGFSGHSMMAAAVLPVLFHLCTPAARPGLARLGLAAGVGLALLIGWSRLAVHAHSVSEVIGGLAIGLTASLAFLGWPGRPSLPHSVAPLIAAMLVFGILQTLPLSGLSGSTHRWVVSMALYMSGRDRPYHRGEWRAFAADAMRPAASLRSRADHPA